MSWLHETASHDYMFHWWNYGTYGIYTECKGNICNKRYPVGVLYQPSLEKCDTVPSTITMLGIKL